MWDKIERRKDRLMSDSFQPQTPFEGFVYANLENIKETIKGLPCKESANRINNVEKKIANIEGRATILGTIAGFITALITKYIWGK